MNPQKTQFTSACHSLPADCLTPVGLYLRLRDHFAPSCLLESTDFQRRDNSYSFIGLQPERRFQITGKTQENVLEKLKHFLEGLEVKTTSEVAEKFNGIFGFSSFESARYFDDLKIQDTRPGDNTPEMSYSFYRFLLVFDHYHDKLHVIENCPEGENSALPKLLPLIQREGAVTHPFRALGEEKSPLSDEDFEKLVRTGKENCQQGEVFQVVFARRFSQKFQGDEFNVYRALRSVNPSPYLFFFDEGDYKIFGSSPEAQLVIQDSIAEIHPIAGTFARTGNDEKDREEALRLLENPKENAEHMMLVDLARNDLNRHLENVQVPKFREIQFFSHVIHLVSRVTGELKSDTDSLRVMGDAFPAGTLSGAPKIRAMQLIAEHEPHRRGFYGGMLGLIRLNGEMNKAIIIRSFLSQNQTLHYQAGAGVVIGSDPTLERQEVQHKLGALRKAIREAEKF